MIASLDFKSVTLNPFEVRAVSVTGSVFSCLTSTGQYWASFDGGPFIPLQGGLQIDNRPNLFTTVILQNQTAVPLTLTFYCGTCAVTYSPVTVSVVNTNAPTYSKGSGILVLAAKSFNGQDTVGGVVKARKQIIITNLPGDGVNPLVVQDAAGNTLAQIPTGQAWTAESNGSFTVINAYGVQYIVGETFYV